MCDKAYLRQVAAQDAFWAGIINKYIDRVEHLEQEKRIRQDVVNGLEVSLPGVFTFNANKLAKKNPGATLDSLFTPRVTKRISETKRCFKKPDLKNVSIFDMTDKDINNLNIIKHLVEDEQSLVDDINRLMSKEQEILKAKNKIERLFTQSQANPTVNVDSRLLEQFYNRLLRDNENLTEELKEVETELDNLRNAENDLKESLKNAKAETESLKERIKNFDEGEDENGVTKPRKTIQNLKEVLKMNSEKLKEEVKNNCFLKCEIAKIRRVVGQLEKDVTKKMLDDAAANADDNVEKEIKVVQLSNEEDL